MKYYFPKHLKGYSEAKIWSSLNMWTNIWILGYFKMLLWCKIWLFSDVKKKMIGRPYKNYPLMLNSCPFQISKSKNRSSDILKWFSKTMNILKEQIKKSFLIFQYRTLSIISGHFKIKKSLSLSSFQKFYNKSFCFTFFLDLCAKLD